MRNSKIDYAIKKAKINKIYDDMQLSNLITYINIVARRIRKDYSDLDGIELQEKIFEELDDISKGFCDIANLKGIYFQLIAAREVIKDKEYIKSVLAEIGDRKIEEDEIFFTDNHAKNKEVAVKQSWKMYSELDKKSLKFLEEYLEKNKGTKDSDFLEKKVKLILGAPEDISCETIKSQIAMIEKDLKEEIIKVLEFLGEFFEKYSLLDRYLTKHNSNMIGISCSELKHELSTGKFDLDSIGIKELFSREVLEKLDIDTLMMLNVFYQNRFSKEIASVGEAIFAINTLDLWRKTKKEERIELRSEELNGLKNKMSCLENISSRLFEEILTQVSLQSESSEKGYRTIEITDKLQRIARHNGVEYKTIFTKILPNSENDLARDLPLYNTIVNIRDNIYIMRECMLSSFLYSLMKDKSVKNFGVIKNEYINGKFVNKLNSKYILLGIDHEGLNMPVRLHVNKQNLIELLNSYFGNSIIQEYEGAEDFVIGRELVSTSILMPLSKKSKKAINELYKASKGKKFEKFISHIRFLKEPGMGKFPKHLMKQNITPKGIKYVMKPKKYVNLQTGQEYVLDENNNLVQNGGEVDFE